MSANELIIEGVKQNNLKNISLRLPHNKVIAITGVSGSGKSSLAFETIFAEGQWRFIESLSTYARLFMEKLDRPDVDAIRNIRPAIALEQRNPVRGSRSTVGTLTELYDLFRLLYAKVGTPHCPNCGEVIVNWDPSSISAELASGHSERKAVITFSSQRPMQELRQSGFERVMKDGAIVDIDELPADAASPFDVVLDRLVIRDEPRLSDSVETAFSEGRGRIKVFIIDGPALSFGKGATCDACGTEMPEASPLLFSFNHPTGACPECKGFGNVLKYARELSVPDEGLSLAKGAVEPWEKPAAKWWKKQLLKGAKEAGIDTGRPFNELPTAQQEMVFKGCKEFYGIDDFFVELESKRYRLHVRVFLSRYRKAIVCPVCNGKRINKGALSYKIGRLDIAQMTALSIKELVALFAKVDLSPFQKDLAKELLRQIGLKLGFLARVGLEYLTLSREGKTLSGGEYQRVNLSNQLASRLTGTLYVLDEPTVGLHMRDTERVSEIMAELASIGNSVIVVEHDKSIIAKSDYVVELGPGGGHNGGNIVFDGPIGEFMQSSTITAQHIRNGKHAGRPRRQRQSQGSIRITGASGNNLKSVAVSFPLGLMSVVTGVSGSGKSSLVVDTLYSALASKLRSSSDLEPPLPFRTLSGYEDVSAVKLIDQSPIGRSPRSNPISYLKIFDPIRRIFSQLPEARAHGFGPGYFSFNVPGGRCEICKGEGYQKLEMYFFEDLYIKCEECGGMRYTHDALNVKYKGKSIHDVLDTTVDEALALFADNSQIHGKLSLMKEIGLGYLRLGQAATTLSGGEAQRLKLCLELGSGRLQDALYILDEPTVGLHPADVGKLMDVLARIVDSGNTVIIIEHNPEVIEMADWIIDIGPEGGDQGGEVIFEGTPAGILRSRKSHTGKYLKQSA